MKKTILVPVDGSEASFRALDYACKEAELRDGKVVVLNVVVPYDISVLALKDIELRAKEIDGAEIAKVNVAKMPVNQTNFILQAALKRAHKDGCKDVTSEEIIDSNPAKTIVERASALKAELVVIGNRGMGNFAEIFLGSVSMKVANYANCPVVITK